MVNGWAIAIGINQYQNFQPLLYAQRDAQAFRDFWVEAGLPPEQCFLLTDTSPAFEQQATSPTRDHIQHYIARLCQQQLQPDDLLWCFFSGYGVQVQGQDYLMPLEGDPAQVETSAIAIATLMETLRSAPTSNLVLALDMNRSQGILGGEGVGRQTAELAEQYGIPTLLSCRPEQFSYETLALRQGFFTTALIEGLRYQGCITLEAMAQYLSDRLPELSDHHWRPRQEPFCIIPAERRYQLILPGKALVTTALPQKTPGQTISKSGDVTENQLPSGTVPRVQPGTPASGGLGPSSNGRHNVAPVQPLPVLPPPKPEEDGVGIDNVFWRQLILWGSVVAIALLVAVLLRNQTAWERDNLPGGPPADLIDPITGADDSAQVAPLNVPEAEGEGSNGETATQPNGAANGNGEANPTGTNAGAPNGSAAGNGNGSDPSAGETSGSTPSPNAGNDASANANANSAAQPPQSSLQDRNQAILDRARITVSQERAPSPASQASSFSRAIAIAQEIRSGQPLYEEAQREIQRWNQLIFEIAQNRANQRNRGSTLTAARNYNSAIAAARLVRREPAALHQQAQASIARWSQQILTLAKARAQEGKFNTAVQAAELVPPNTPAFGEAQRAIASW